ncbi:hypothetical protein AGABI2DRAFT_202508 [Agaricus bisporus var. bisporus H97]|uniref:hypothetical protein n=1 Tax=Agaricus bisporus var. bisporus (strain H97 / ATCC MYA-4626 / FGSC 10389) TaxID=936046 RepID=UPI00029F5C66|nr:hypothetical protein AGABI2DRAFT_202508 [Agaricus bisporus var. bisporus H97]EKV48111.1 hypothetical protein AGABI2DRAFT_202508 [Agaricus bisporus var. bisporus H97]
MSFQNLYYKRTAGTAKACFVCYRPSTTVLATINTVDFIYVCPSHLSDLNFASQVKEETKSQVTTEEIAKVKAEWEEKQKRKKEKEKEAAKAEKEKKTEEKKGEGQESKDKADDKKEDKPDSRTTTPSRPSPSTAPAPAHERYILHRDFFAMRQGEHRRRRQTAQAREMGTRLPGAPSGSVG